MVRTLSATRAAQQAKERPRSACPVLVASLFVIAAAACAPAVAPSTEAPLRGGRVIEAIDSEPKTLLPLFEGTDARLNRLLYEPLGRWDAKSGAMVQGLGTWTIAPDGRTYTVTLAAKANWSDGKPAQRTTRRG